MGITFSTHLRHSGFALQLHPFLRLQPFAILQIPRTTFALEFAISLIEIESEIDVYIVYYFEIYNNANISLSIKWGYLFIMHFHISSTSMCRACLYLMEMYARKINDRFRFLMANTNISLSIKFSTLRKYWISWYPMILRLIMWSYIITHIKRVENRIYINIYVTLTNN